MKTQYSLTFWTGVLASLIYLTFTILAYIQYPTPFSPQANWLSDLGNVVTNQRGATFYNTGVIITALLVVAWFGTLSEWRTDHVAPKRLLLVSQVSGAIAGFALIMSALHPINLPEHSTWSQIHFSMLGIGFGFSVAALRYNACFPKSLLSVGVITAALPLSMFFLSEVRWLEWVAVASMIVYVLLVGIATRSMARSRKTNILVSGVKI